MGKKSGAEMEVTEYRLSKHFGICAGPVDFIRRVYIGEKEAWAGQERELTDISINKPDLFGGIQKEGGVSGSLVYLPGEEDQVMPSRLADKFGLTVDEMPAYRGIATAFFCEPSGDSRKGFYWVANNPYLKGTWIEVARTSVGLNDNYARIARGEFISTDTAVYLAFDLSGSMADGFEPGSLRLTNLKTALTGVLEYMRDTLTVDIDIVLVGWSTSTVSIERRLVDATGYNELIAWVADRTAVGGTDFNAAVSLADAFFSDAATGPKNRVSIILTDGVGDNAVPARATLDAIGAVTMYAMNIDVVDTTETAILDNTADDGVPVISGGDPAALQAAIQASLQARGEFDSNPAHIIYECLTNKTWGMGTAAAQIDLASFEAAAVTLFNEGFGLSLLWVRQTTIEAFTQEILDHVEAQFFINPQTGLLTLKLIRNDYVVGDLRVFSPDNADILNFKRRLWGETTNEITVTWTNPTNEEDATVTAQDSGNIAIQGDIVAASRNYYGIRTVALATKVAYRDLRAAAAPLASCDIETDRSAWDLLPGDVCKITSPEDGISQLVMRVGPVDYGRPGSPTIKASLIEDVFALSQAEYTTPGETAWEDPREDPAAAAAEYAFTLPYFLAANDLGVAALAAFEEYPTVFSGVLASQTGFDTATFDLWGDLTGATGTSAVSFLGNKTIISRALLDVALAQEIVSTIPATLTRTLGEGPAVGGFVVIGSGAEAAVELALITAVDATDITVKRGVLDTTPKDWPIGTPIWFIDHDHRYIDDHPRSAAELVNYYVLPRTSKGALALADATALPLTLSERPYLPLRPANVKAGGQAFGEYDAQLVDPVPITWDPRNRLTEETVVLDWDDAGVAVETNQTTQIIVMDIDRNVITSHTGEVGSSFDLPHTSFGAFGRGIVRVQAERDGLVSLQGHEITVIVESGYGYGYGYDYGGT